jgi:hypothetical protein
MTGETDLGTLLRSMSATQRPGAFVFVVTEPDRGLPAAEVEASVVEPEGRSVVTTQAAADRAGLAYDYVAGWVTLQVHSALAAVGLTAAVSRALADAGLSCNVIAGYHHDHLLVPFHETERALAVLAELSRSA